MRAKGDPEKKLKLKRPTNKKHISKLVFNLFVCILYLKTFCKGSHKLCTEVNTDQTCHPSNKCSKNSSIPSQEKKCQLQWTQQHKKARKLDSRNSHQEKLQELGLPQGQTKYLTQDQGGRIWHIQRLNNTLWIPTQCLQ